MDNEKKIYNKGVLRGTIIGVLSMLIISAILYGTVISKYYSAATIEDRASLDLGDDVTNKINSLLDYIDEGFLFDYKESDIDDAIYKAVMSGLGDKYSVYYTAEEYSDLMDSTNGTYYGIGVVVSQNTDSGELVVVQPYKDAPGAKAGIQIGDVILAVDGTEVTGMDSDLAVDLIRGDEGTKVTLTIRRDDETFDVDVTRAKVEVETVSYEMKENKIGYIAVTQFDGVTTEQFAAAMKDLIKQGMTGLIVDIRNNPGGRLDVVKEMLDSLLPEGIIVYTEDKNGQKTYYNSDESSILDVPMAILVNGNSASASEIFSGAMQDYKLAQIIGTQTFGKGIVQTIIPFEDGSAIKMTVEKYYTPNGTNIHGIGITPDQVVELDEDQYAADGTDTQLNAAITYIEEQQK